jgi:hypothetical protein
MLVQAPCSQAAHRRASLSPCNIKDADQSTVLPLQKYIAQAEKDKGRYQKDLEK